MAENETDNVPAKVDAPLQVNANVLPERAYASQKVTDPLPPALIERVGQLILTEKQQAILLEPVPDDEISIRFDGFIYVSHEFCRRKLHEAFGPLGWNMIEASPLAVFPGTNQWYQKWVMLVGGVFAGVSMSAMEWMKDNPKQDLGHVYETIQSDCVRRISGKVLGLGLEAWNKRRQKQWRDTFAKRMLCRIRNETKVQWRRIDDDPFIGWDGKSIEIGEYKDVPETPDGKRTPQQSAPPPQPEPPRAPKVEVVHDEPPKQAAPQPPKPATGGMKILPAQERMIFARMRTAQLLVGDDGVPAMEWLMNEMGIELIQDDGKTSAENLAAMIKEIPGARVTECAKKLDALKGAQA